LIFQEIERTFTANAKSHKQFSMGADFFLQKMNLPRSLIIAVGRKSSGAFFAKKGCR
jgi:hypothetical protein